MANIKSAIKRIRSNKRKASYNSFHKTKVATMLKRITKALESDKVTQENKKTLYKNLQKAVDKAVAKKAMSKAKGKKVKSRSKSKLKV